MFALNSAEVFDEMLVFAAPGDEGRSGDFEFGFEAAVGPALDAQLNKAVLGFRGMHNDSFFSMVITDGVGQIPSE
jgi:hypothetical protein